LLVANFYFQIFNAILLREKTSSPIYENYSEMSLQLENRGKDRWLPLEKHEEKCTPGRKQLAFCTSYPAPTLFLNLQKRFLNVQAGWRSSNIVHTIAHNQTFFITTPSSRKEITNSSSTSEDISWVLEIRKPASGPSITAWNRNH
jgi:hypothetical protein